MTRLKQVKCPNCRTILRFKPTASEVVAITCIQCGNLFEVQVAARLPVESQPIKAMPVAVLPIAAQPVDPNQESSAAIPVLPVKQVHLNQASSVSGVSQAGGRPAAQAAQQSVQPDKNSNKGNSNLATELGSLASPRQTPVVVPVKNNRRAGNSHSRPTVPRLETRSSLMMPLMIVLGLAMVVLFGGFAFMASIPSGRSYLKSINPLLNSPERVASKLNRYIEQYVAIIDKVQAEQDYSQAVEELGALEDRISELAFSAAELDAVDDARHETLMASIEVGNKLQFASLDTSRWLEAEGDAALSKGIADATNAMNVVQDLVMRVMKEPSKPESKTDQVCLEGLLLERKILRCIASAKGSEEVGPMLDSLQVLIDRFNELAENQKKSGERVGFIPRDYEGLETGGQNARDWFLTYIQEKYTVPEAFLPTVDDLKYVESRFDGALFKSEIEMLSTTSRERVEAAMKSDVAYRVPEAQDKSLANLEPPASSNVASSAKNSMAPRESVGTQMPASQNNAVAATRQQPSELSNQQDEAREDIHPRSEERSSPRESPARNQNLLSGPNSLTIKVFGGNSINAEELSQRMKRKVGSSRSAVITEGDAIILNFSYSGDLADVAQHIDFGKIDLSDSQSRTIFVDAN